MENDLLSLCAVGKELVKRRGELGRRFMEAVFHIHRDCFISTFHVAGM